MGQTPDGEVLCTDHRGSSHAVGMEWHIGPNMLGYLIEQAEKREDWKELKNLAELLEGLPVPNPELGRQCRKRIRGGEEKDKVGAFAPHL